MTSVQHCHTPKKGVSINCTAWPWCSANRKINKKFFENKRNFVTHLHGLILALVLECIKVALEAFPLLLLARHVLAQLVALRLRLLERAAHGLGLLLQLGNVRLVALVDRRLLHLQLLHALLQTRHLGTKQWTNDIYTMLCYSLPTWWQDSELIIYMHGSAPDAPPGDKTVN